MKLLTYPDAKNYPEFHSLNILKKEVLIVHKPVPEFGSFETPSLFHPS